MKPKKESLSQSWEYYVKGMHCASCELLIEKRLLEEKNIQAAEASVFQKTVRIDYYGKRPTTKKLNKIFAANGYTFYNYPLKDKDNGLNLAVVLGIPTVIIAGFWAANKYGFTALLRVNSQSALPAFFIFGLLAGFSTCSGLLGGIILSMSKQAAKVHQREASSLKKFQPHFLFNTGRLLSFSLFGALLGVLGQTLVVSTSLGSLLSVGVSLFMIFLGLQMLGVSALSRFQFSVPKNLSKFFSNQDSFGSRLAPFLIGFFTLFLPCGFTLTTQALALASENPFQGALIMLFFALGTLPALLMIGLSSLKFIQKPHLANQFLKTAATLVMFFGIYNLNSQLNLLGLKSLNDLSLSSSLAEISPEDLPPLINGKQLLKMDALAFGYEPSQLKVRAGIPVRWEITDKGTSGCTNAIVSRGLFDGQISLTPGTTSVKEFTPEKAGKYKFSCWMGMVSGVIEVVDEKQLGGKATGASQVVIDSGVQGCGSSGGGCQGSCRGTCGNPGCPYAQ